MYGQENLFAVDTAGVDTLGGYEVFPAGMYPAVMVSAAKKATSRNDGSWFIECVYSIIDGPHSGKRYTSRMNLGNANTTAVEIAKRELKSLRKALGLGDQVSDLGSYVNKPLVLNITAKPRKDDPSKAENNLIGIEPYGAQGSPTAPQQYNGTHAPTPPFPPSQPGPAPVPPQQWMPAPAVAGTAPPMPPQQPQQQQWQPQPSQTPPWAAGAR